MNQDINGKKCELLPAGKEFELRVGGQLVRTDSNPRVLSAWALQNGAAEVQWAFDLKLAEGAK